MTLNEFYSILEKAKGSFTFEPLPSSYHDLQK